MSDNATNHDDRDVADIIFIGAGPVSLYGVYYAGLRMMKTKVIEMLDFVGGGLMALYPEKYIFDMAGIPKVLAKDLVEQMEIQARQYPNTFYFGEEVTELGRTDDGLVCLRTTKGEHYSKTAVICAGLGAYVPKQLDIPNVRELEGKGVFYHARCLDDFRDKDILIVGGGDSAFDHSMMLEPVARKITHIHRNDFFLAHEDSVHKVKKSSVDLKVPFWEIRSIEGSQRVEAATIVQSRTGEEVRLEVEAVIFNIGFSTDLGPIANWGLVMKKKSIVVDTLMRTSIEGIYAAGDIVTYDGKVDLISTGCGEVAIAVNNARHYYDPKAKVSPGHSTDKQPIVMKKIARQRKRDNQKEQA